jgi:UDP-N-acetylmuramoyl-L-alanyl-D-glutamate--2,6-diaminopimelate ligase
VQGFSQPGRHEVILDRKEAISRALSLASRDDIILIAGKGHETSQIFSHKTIEFDDRRVAAELCRSLSQVTP